MKLHNLRLHLRLLNRIRRRGPRRGELSSAKERRPRPENLAVLGIFKNETHLIEEWCQHYYLDQGVDRIFLIDNGSTDDTVAKLARWTSEGRVEVISLPEPHRQQQHYWTAFQHFRIAERCDWLAIADIDEFWFCKSGETLASYLKRQTDVDGLYALWTNFGSGGHEKQPESVRQSLVDCDPRLGPQTKCIFRTFLPKAVKDIEVHFVGNLALRRAKIATRDLQLNHYVAQSRQFWFEVKLTRGDVFFARPDPSAIAARFDAVNQACTATDTRLRDLVASGFKP